MKLIFLGRPGAGKGTVATAASEEYHIPQISTGEIFRQAINDRTSMGLKIASLIEKGCLVPDEMTIALVRERLAKRDAARGFILDGFPRTISQAEALREFQAIDAVVNFQTDNDVVIRRLSGRRVCRTCGAIYHVANIPPRREGICDRCDGELYIRDDDKIVAITRRLKVYREQTEPLIRYYEKLGLLRNIDASRNAEASLGQIRQLMAAIPG